MFGGAYGVEVTVDNAHRMQILQSAGHFCELHNCLRIWGLRGKGRDLAYRTKEVDFRVL